MNKVINVCGYEIPVSYNAASLIRYKMVFHRDGMRDLMLLAKGGDEGMIENENFDLDVFYRFLWIFAKSANPDLPEMVEWLEGFDVPPLDFAQEALPQVQELLIDNMKTTVKSKKK